MITGASDIFAAVLAVLLLMAAWSDWRSRIISNELNAVIALLAIVWWIVGGYPIWPDIGLRVILALGMFGVFALLFALRIMGGGDVKMMGAFALWLPMPLVLPMLFVTAIAGGLIAGFLAIRARFRPNEAPPEVPYGIAIALGGFWVMANGLLTIRAA